MGQDVSDLFDKFQPMIDLRAGLLASGVEDPFGLVMERVLSPTVAVCNGRETILLGTYNYMGMTFDPDVIDAGKQALDDFGSGTTGSRVLNGTYAGHKAVEQAFATQLKVGTFPNGHKTIAAATPLSLPGALRTNGAVVGGLSGFIRVQSHAHKVAIPQNRYSTAGPYWFTDLKQAYKYPSYKVLSGKGVTIGILMEGDFNPADMALYFGHEKLAVPKMSTVNINGGAPYDPEGSFETHLDMQQTGGMAPDAKIVLYNLPDLYDNNIIDGLLTILDQNKADVVSMSFGGPEIFYTPAYNDGDDYTGILGIYDDIFKQGNALGITFVASSGDQGALSDAMTARFGAEALRYAMLSGLVLYLLAGVLMWFAARPLRRDWTE